MGIVCNNGGGRPASPDESIQYNNGGIFGGFGTWDGNNFDVTGSIEATAISVIKKTDGNEGSTIELRNSYYDDTYEDYVGTIALDFNHPVAGLVANFAYIGLAEAEGMGATTDFFWVNGNPGNIPTSIGGTKVIVGLTTPDGSAAKFQVNGSIHPTGYLSNDKSAGISGTLTTASLVGKTLTFKDGLITAFA